MLLPFLNDPFVEAIAKRVRGVVVRQPWHSLPAAAEALGVSVDALEGLMDPQAPRIDSSFLIDVVSALVYECGVDPSWLLSGEYDGEMHRDALLLGEDRTSRGARVMRNFVHEEFRRLRHARLFLHLPSSRSMPFSKR